MGYIDDRDGCWDQFIEQRGGANLVAKRLSRKSIMRWSLQLNRIWIGRFFLAQYKLD